MAYTLPTFGTPSLGIEQLRKKQMFDNFFAQNQAPERQPAEGLFQPSSPIPPDRGEVPTPSFQEMMDQIPSPSTVDRDRFRGLLDQAPQRQEPDITRRLVATGMGLSSRFDRNRDPLKTMDAVLEEPNVRRMKEWTDKATPFYQGASLENTANVNERQIATSVLNNRTALEKAAATERTQNEKNRIADVRAQAYRWKSMLPTWDWDTTGPTYVLKNRDTGEIRDTKIKTGELDERTLQELKNTGNLAAAEARAKGTYATAAMTKTTHYKDQQGNLYYIDPSNPSQPQPVGDSPQTPVGDLTEVKAAPTGASARTNTMEKVRQRNDKLGAAWQTEGPEIKRFIKRISEKEYTYQPRPVLGAPKGGLFSTGKITQDDVDAYDEFRSSIEPDYVPPTNPATTPPASTPPPARPPAAGRGTSYNPPTKKIPPLTTADPNRPPTPIGSPQASSNEAVTGPRIRFRDPATGRTGTIPDNPEAIKAAREAGYRLELIVRPPVGR